MVVRQHLLSSVIFLSNPFSIPCPQHLFTLSFDFSASGCTDIRIALSGFCLQACFSCLLLTFPNHFSHLSVSLPDIFATRTALHTSRFLSCYSVLPCQHPRNNSSFLLYSTNPLSMDTVCMWLKRQSFYLLPTDTLQTELRTGSVKTPSRLTDIYVPAQKLYRNRHWFPDKPQHGRVYVKPKRKSLKQQFGKQIKQVWKVRK